MAGYTVLICDDNGVVHESLRSYLEAEGIGVLSAYDGESALRLQREMPADAIVLDVMLPGMDGYEVCRALRREGDVPIIMLSARGEDIDRIVGLEVGADDYLTKPVSPRELTIRIKKLLRRAQPAAEPKKLTIGELTVLPDNYQAFLDGEELTLTAKELDVLAFLLANRGKVLTREHILNAAWGYEYCGDTRAVDTLIKRLRQKLGRDGVHFAIRSVYGIGYKMEEKL